MKKNRIKIVIDGTTTIAPKALNGDRVSVHNYKKKIKTANGMVDAGRWETGVVDSVSSGWHRYQDGAVKVNHTYEVILDRRTNNRYGESIKYLRLTVGDNGIEKIK